MDHRALIAKAQAGDPSAFDELFRACYAPVFRFVFIRLKSHDDAEEITQDVFVKMLASLSRYEDRGPSLLPYLFTLARNAVIDLVRKRKPELDDEALWALPSGDPTPEESARLGEETAHVLKLLNQLSEAERDALRLKYLDGFSTAEVAATLGKTEEAVRQLVSRGVRRIRSLYESSGS
jgi:RNA polymerase sigma-70 factor (ECF subfamily)